MKKQLQFEIWEECNSKCKFCYLGKNNLLTPNHVKLKSLQLILDKISDLSIYDEYDVISYLGGEFFQGQLNTPEIKELFFKLMEETAWLLENKYIREVWIYATLTIGNQEDLYKSLEYFKQKEGLWILTSYDTLGRFHTKKMEDNWKYHMKNLHKLYPEIKFNTTTILSDDCIDKYLSGELSFKQMMEEFHTAFFFKQCGLGDCTKEEMNERLPGFLTTRDKFLKFLTKFKQDESEHMWTKLFNIQYRADTLYRNFNDDRHMQITIRNKDKKAELTTDNEIEMQLNECGHPLSYATYLDSNKCALCDKQLIEETVI